MNSYLKKIHNELDKFGVLMLTDPSLPSLVAVISGKPVKGSWWGHPKGNLMYNISNELMDSPEILTLKLINKKITFIHRRHWNALLSITTSGKQWQKKDLSVSCKSLFQRVQREGKLRIDDSRLAKPPAEVGKLASQLETRLLVYSESVHTDSGKHVRQLSSWDNVKHGKKGKFVAVPYDEALENFEKIKMDMSAKYSTKIKFPWS